MIPCSRLVPVILTAFALTCLGCASSSVPTLVSENPFRPQCVRYTLRSPAVADNGIGTPAEVTLEVVLPVSYDSSDTRYPVVYYLHGFNSSANEVYRWLPFVKEAVPGKEFILVGVEGKNSLQGGFWVNSALGGRWEDWLVAEAVPFIDRTLRTIPAAPSRGLVGMSMGGFGALYHAFRHPEVFSAVYAIAPGVLAPETGLREAVGSWKSDAQFRKAYGAAFAGNMADTPSFDGTPADTALAALWESGFGGWEARVDAYLAGTARLSALGIEWGSNDGYRWIPKGSSYLVQYLRGRGIAVQSEEFLGGHEIIADRISGTVFPFFTEHLAF